MQQQVSVVYKYACTYICTHTLTQIFKILPLSLLSLLVGIDLPVQIVTVHFSAGHSSVIANFTINNDTTPEPDEVFVIGFTKDQNINIGMPSVAELTILGDSKYCG